MIFKRLLMPMLILGIVFTTGSMVYAQAITCGVGAGTSGPSTNATSTGHTEPVGAGPIEIPGDTAVGSTGTNPALRIPGGGAIRVTCTNTGAVGTATTPGVIVLTVSLGVPITNSSTFPSGAGIRLGNFTGDFAATNVGISSLGNAAGTIVLGLGTPAATSTASPNTGILFTAGSTATPTTSSFDILGVLVSTNGLKSPVNATLVASTANVTIGTIGTTTLPSGPVQPVIKNVIPGLVDPTLVSGTLPAGLTGNAAGNNISCSGTCAGGPAVLGTNGTATKGNFTLRIQENYPDMFKSAAQFNGGATFPVGTSSSTQVNVVLSGVPSGLSISSCTAILTDASGTFVSGPVSTTGGSPIVTPNNASSNTLNVIFQSDVDQSVVNVLYVTCGSVGVGSATLPLPSAPVTAQVTLAPTGAALSAIVTAPVLTSLTTGQIPRYQQSLQPATGIPVITFPPSQTTLLIPFADVGPGFNTGIAIANTSLDVFGTANGGATPTAGTITFTMYPSSGAAALTSTTASIAGGASYINNLSSILPSGTTSFSGYIFVTANFPEAHGSATIYDTTTGHAALSAPVLVVESGGQNISSAVGRAVPESLGQ